jgi:fucose 4-O-acetylase-like acetyltransferase
MKRLFFTFLAGLLICAVTIGIADRINGRYWSVLYAALLGISSTMGDLAHLRAGTVPMALAGVLLSAVFVVAEVLRSRNSWLRWVGYGFWAVLAIATLLWFKPPVI